MRIAKIKPNDVVNGIGVTVSVFVQGCPHHCKGCFNKETWDFDGGREFNDIEAEKILKLLDKNGVKRNLSILGGEPLAKENVVGVLNLIYFIKSKRPETIIYLWSGYTYEEIELMYKDAIFRKIDYLIDGKFEEDKKDFKLLLRGSSNQRVIKLSKNPYQ